MKNLTKLLSLLLFPIVIASITTSCKKSSDPEVDPKVVAQQKKNAILASTDAQRIDKLARLIETIKGLQANTINYGSVNATIGFPGTAAEKAFLNTDLFNVDSLVTAKAFRLVTTTGSNNGLFHFSTVVPQANPLRPIGYYVATGKKTDGSISGYSIVKFTVNDPTKIATPEFTGFLPLVSIEYLIQ